MKIFFFIVLLCILAPFLNIFCFCQVHTISVLYCAHLCMKCSLGISDFLAEISSLPYSTVFLYLLIIVCLSRNNPCGLPNTDADFCEYVNCIQSQCSSHRHL